MDMQPAICTSNAESNIFMVASPNDGRLINVDTEHEYEIHDEHNLTFFKQCVYDKQDRRFIILGNKHDEKIGFFMLVLPEREIKKAYFLLKWKNKLDIGDADMYILETKKNGYRELIASYKTIYLNTYNVMSLDI